jgi:hypothetical protein
MDTYALEKLTGWTPELSPPQDSPLYRWRVLAAKVMPLSLPNGKMSFRAERSEDPESRDSGSGPSDHPGMTRSTI